MKWLWVAIVMAVYSAVGYVLAWLFEAPLLLVTWFIWPALPPIWAYQWCQERLARRKDNKRL